MKSDEYKLVLHDYENVSELADDELIELISKILDIEEVPSAVEELYLRQPDTAIDHARSIMENSLGDEYMQAGVVQFLFEYDNDFVIRFVADSLDKMNYYVYGCVLECFALESEQPFAEKLPGQFPESISKRYEKYTIEEKSKIAEAYKMFTEAYA